MWSNIVLRVGDMTFECGEPIEHERLVTVLPSDGVDLWGRVS